MLTFAINVQALCVPSDDWPGMPCTGPQGKPNLEKWKQAWNEYYQYKGKDWMEMKKSEMDNAITGGNLKEWTGFSEANYNVWNYYWINDQAPNPLGVSLNEAFDTSNPHEPLFEQIAVAVSTSAAVIAAIVLIAHKRTKKIAKI